MLQLIPRHPITKVPEFHSCNLCYGKTNCCPHVSSCLHPIIIPRGHTNWTETLQLIHQYKALKVNIRLVAEQELPDEVLWDAAYSAWNCVQVNVNILQPWAAMTWAISLVHKVKTCGLEGVLMVYPIVPIHVRTYQVLQLVATIAECTHCKVMIRFGEFMDDCPLVDSGFVRLMGSKIPLSQVHCIGGNLWGCSDDYKSQFMEYLRFYADATKIDVQPCEVIR